MLMLMLMLLKKPLPNQGQIQAHKIKDHNVVQNNKLFSV